MNRITRDSMLYLDLDEANQKQAAKLRAMVHQNGGNVSKDTYGEMLEVERVFTMIHNYCAESLTTSNRMLEKHVTDLLNPELTVSPLLKYFNDLAKHCHFRLPLPAVLEFDQRYFRETLAKYRGAQKSEVRWMKETVIEQARAMLNKSFAEARQLLQKELKDIYWQFDELKKGIGSKEKEINLLKS
jgi:sugar diacid utilization regulator